MKMDAPVLRNMEAGEVLVLAAVSVTLQNWWLQQDS